MAFTIVAAPCFCLKISMPRDGAGPVCHFGRIAQVDLAVRPVADGIEGALLLGCQFFLNRHVREAKQTFSEKPTNAVMS